LPDDTIFKKAGQNPPPFFFPCTAGRICAYSRLRTDSKRGENGMPIDNPKATPSPSPDFRLRARLETLEELPDEARDHLVSFLDSLLDAYRVITQHRPEGKMDAGRS
jgi:hypothetical protein